MTWIGILTLIASLGPKIPQAIALIQALIALLSVPTGPTTAPSGGLNDEIFTQEEVNLIGKISEAVTTGDSEAMIAQMIDFSKFRTFFKSHPLFASTLATVLKGVISGS